MFHEAVSFLEAALLFNSLMATDLIFSCRLENGISCSWYRRPQKCKNRFMNFDTRHTIFRIQMPKAVLNFLYMHKLLIGTHGINRPAIRYTNVSMKSVVQPASEHEFQFSSFQNLCNSTMYSIFVGTRYCRYVPIGANSHLRLYAFIRSNFSITFIEQCVCESCME